MGIFEYLTQEAAPLIQNSSLEVPINFILTFVWVVSGCIILYMSLKNKAALREAKISRILFGVAVFWIGIAFLCRAIGYFHNYYHIYIILRIITLITSVAFFLYLPIGMKSTNQEIHMYVGAMRKIRLANDQAKAAEAKAQKLLDIIKQYEEKKNDNSGSDT